MAKVLKISLALVAVLASSYVSATDGHEKTTHNGWGHQEVKSHGWGQEEVKGHGWGDDKSQGWGSYKVITRARGTRVVDTAASMS
ncbi:unnamed protein product [Allacma fusca]|uniref:Uncharacterized protein n=1 Tax=Allacma fusca TaxID=39272 RepID=A0A8J2J6B2_9HEXA|nr:unnamed protein product [Allacma fusca]